MPTVGSFGGKRFKTSKTYIYALGHEISMEMGLSIEEQEKEGDKPSTYIKGTNLKKLKLNINLLKHGSVDVLKEIDSWEKVMESKKAYPLILNSKKIGKNNYILTNVNVSETYLSPTGEILKAKIELSLAEYIRKGRKKEGS